MEAGILTQAQTESLYQVLDQATLVLAEELETTYLDALIEISEDLFAKQIQVEAGRPSERVQARLEQLFGGINVDTMDGETIRQAIQLALLRAMKTDKIQANHQLTPDTIGFLVAYLLESLTSKVSELTILDPVVGTGNLLATVLHRLNARPELDVKAVGVDVDDTMLAMAGVSFDLQHTDVALIEADATSTALPKADAVIADLPLMHDNRSETVDNELIYHSLQALNECGYGIYIVPSSLLDTAEAVKLIKELTTTAYLQGFLKLPTELFKDVRAQKALLIVQRHGGSAKQADQVLLGTFPSFKDVQAFQAFLGNINAWVSQLG
ncbi:class I SAM-dependent methyltransferase [Periweissella cryptocerci]|uniref:Class I SAM-dependent methyltransferase n=1 Tax=Periweissella cryptocerci TaxID=2506420 RepID=A0A4P6YRR4_9LACO|nr:class I SAM-dependent methyltransferase [Periweissella cryptocerci]QBO35359.1 class I SAM-dependent methyltransferase [Periweissella cryptocerci]